MSDHFDSNRGGLIVVLTTVFGPAGKGMARMALDTGATISLLNWEFLVGLGYEPGKEKGRIPVTTGSGVEFVPRLKVKQVEALGQRRRNFSFLCHNLPPSATVDGLLGLDFMRKKRLVVEFRKGILSLD